MHLILIFYEYRNEITDYGVKIFSEALKGFNKILKLKLNLSE